MQERAQNPDFSQIVKISDNLEIRSIHNPSLWDCSKSVLVQISDSQGPKTEHMLVKISDENHRPKTEQNRSDFGRCAKQDR